MCWQPLVTNWSGPQAQWWTSQCADCWSPAWWVVRGGCAEHTCSSSLVPKIKEDCKKLTWEKGWTVNKRDWGGEDKEEREKYLERKAYSNKEKKKTRIWYGHSFIWSSLLRSSCDNCICKNTWIESQVLISPATRHVKRPIRCRCSPCVNRACRACDLAGDAPLPKEIYDTLHKRLSVLALVL